MGLFGAGDPPCPAGSICSGQSMTKVGRTYRTVKKPRRGGGTETVTQAVNTGTDIYHASATKLNTDGTSTTDVYIIKDGKWQKAATSNDGGATYTYDDDVAGAGLKKELSDPQGAIHKNVDANINKAADKAGLPKTEKDKLLDTNPNTENNAPTGDNPAPNAPATAPLKIDANERTDYAQALTYPEDLNQTRQDYLKIMMVKYEPRGLDFQPGGLGIAPRGNLESVQSESTVGGREILSNIFLPIPGGIADQNNVGWAKKEIDPVKVAAAALVGDMIGGGDLRDTLSQISGGVQQNKEGVKEAVVGGLTKSITGVDALSREQGVVLNNNVELLFSGAGVRQFRFTYKFSPRSKDEAATVRQIIRTLKQGMSAKKANNFLFIKSPHTFFLGYYKGGSQRLHPYLNKFKECALTDLSVQYAPAGNYATFVDGSPTQLQVQMSFSELEPVFDDDYGNDNESIGF